ncbi:polymorphic toxin type 23 domain-containing protein [Rubrivirga sp. IMCC45206]|uniref:polymorphic toxin type 23 domain-containing protein n=1 Tax=Rubrivirga sp. IMCC45206 TaxID=3391614 RepID=UPI00399036D7
MRPGVLLLAALLAVPCAAQASGPLLDTPRLQIGAAATAKVGTHETALGARLHAAAPLIRGRSVGLLVRGGVGVEGLVDDLGIPGAGVGAQPGIELAVAFGPPVRRATGDVLQPSVRRHELAYALLGYLDSDGTSQASGGIRYRLATARSVVEVAYENDAFAHLLRDEFRTAAIRVRVVRTDRETPAGLGLRAVLWTGTTAGLGRLTRNETYDLSGQLGGAYSHGILALDAVYGGLTLSLGVDAEGVRSAIQNTFHRLIDDGQIPRRDRAPRLFIRLALNEGGGLY